MERDGGIHAKVARDAQLKELCWILFIQSIPHVGRIPKVQLLLDQFQYLKLSEVLELADPVVRILLSVFTHTFIPREKNPRNGCAKVLIQGELGTTSNNNNLTGVIVGRRSKSLINYLSSRTNNHKSCTHTSVNGNIFFPSSRLGSIVLLQTSILKEQRSKIY